MLVLFVSDVSNVSVVAIVTDVGNVAELDRINLPDEMKTDSPRHDSLITLFNVSTSSEKGV